MLNIIEPENKTQLEWQCVGYNPTTWALGHHIEQGCWAEDGRLTDIRALIARLFNGRWGIRFLPDWVGFIDTEPSRETAMDAVEQYLKRDDVQAYHAFRQAQQDRISSVCAAGARELQVCRTS